MTKKCKRTAIGLVTGFANGLFGSGGGTIVVPAMERFLGEEEHKAHATAIAVILPLSLLSLGVYLWKADLGAVWRIAFWASAGAALSERSCCSVSAGCGCTAFLGHSCLRRQ